jgi:excisionase family DNA binding protein
MAPHSSIQNSLKMNNENMILQQLEMIRHELAELRISKKEVFTFDETCHYLDISASHLYKLTSSEKIPCYQPNGKKLYFKKTEVDDWLLQNKKHSQQEIQEMASRYISTSKKRGGRS